MSGTPWKIGLVILIGSVGGVILRQALMLILPRSREPTSGIMFAATAILGGLFGGVLGAVMTMSALTTEQQSVWLFGLLAALGTFGASAVLTDSKSLEQASSTLRAASMHIGLAIVAAALGIGLFLWARSVG